MTMKNVKELCGRLEKPIPELSLEDVVIIIVNNKKYELIINGIQNNGENRK